ncbi:hypothetical protein O181_039943 [Austropuccinia psidii MF-1]|uniref:Uncharacterized protein n=1 Tax=Austropuccinia psidii MF-1 TaxID=1389203 RepID=A0A9Q3HCE8_9BASI|nr:hypothetical protein [Austropuccinia psidii MF-1]
MKEIDEIQFVKSTIDLELGSFDSKSNKIKLDIHYLKTNKRLSAYWNKLTTARLESISNTCDRIESKYKVQDYGMEDLLITDINDKFKILENHVLEIVYNTSVFATHLARSESESKKLNDEIIAHVEKIHSYIPRRSTLLTEDKLSVKGILTSFLGENKISEKDVPKLEHCPTFSSEGEYNHIEFLRAINITQEDFQIPG